MGKADRIFSIVVPAYERPESLSACLEAVASLSFPRERFEVVVVDDGSDKPLEAVVARFGERMNVRTIYQPNAGPAAARNTGVNAACGKYIAFTDDDCRPHPDWLERLHVALLDNPAAMIGGASVNVLTRNVYSAASQVILDVVYAYFNSDQTPPRFFASNNIAMSRDLFLELKGFDTSFPLAAAEDRDLCDRWRQHGLPLHYAEDAIVNHAHPLTLRRFYRQHYNYGRGAHLYHKRRAERKSGRMYEDIGLHFRLPKLLRKPLSGLPTTMRVRVFALLVVWQAANAHGYIVERFWARGRAQPEGLETVPAGKT